MIKDLPHLVAVGWAWMYDTALKWTAASALPFAVSFGLVPVIVATMLSGHPLPKATIVAANQLPACDDGMLL